MAITTKTETYFDDLNANYRDGSPLDKNYLRVLFKPGLPVQTRELNQAQSILQAQLDRLGSGIFKQNSPVIGGQVTLDSKVRCIEFDISAVTGGLSDELLTEFQKNLTLAQIEVIGIDSSVNKGSITKIQKTGASSGVTHRLYYQTTQGLSKNIIEAISVKLLYGDFTINTYIITPIANKKAIGVTAEAGIYFVRGCMVTSQRQYVARPLEDSDESFNGFVYFSVNENYITNADDPTLNDNANGELASNYSGAGADRYQITLELNLVLASELAAYNNAIKLADVRSGEIYIATANIDQNGSTLENTLANRTYEESGNYVVNNFNIELKELVGNDYKAVYNADNVQTFTGINSTAAANYFAAKLSPGVAYVKGHRVETLAPTVLPISKAKKTYYDLTLEQGQASYYAAATNAAYGNYVVGITNPGSGLPIFTNGSFSCTLKATGSPSNTNIGTAKISSIEIEDILATDQVKLRLYLYDIVFSDQTKNFNDVVQITGANNTNYGAFDFEVKLINGIALNDINNTDSIFQFPNQAIKTVQNLRVSRRISKTVTADGDTNVFAFSPSVNGYTFDASSNSVIVAVDGEIVTTDYYIKSNLDNGISVIFDNELTDNTVVSVIVTETGDIGSSLGTKIKTTESVVPVKITGTDVYELTGVYHAISVSDTKNWILVDDGQRDNEYVKAKVRKIGNASDTTIEITHWKFANNNKNFYTVNSYKIGEGASQADAPLDQIPTYGDINLSDALDCRIFPTQDLAAAPRLSLDPYSAITANIDFYLSRVDLISINSNNSISIIEGKSDIEGKLPNIPDDGMAIYALYIPPFTAEATDVEVRAIENRRYTMADIGNIERRIGAIEYYTSLSLLERDANERSIFGDDGEKFKNGFITDGFRNLDVADTSVPEFLCSIDSQRGVLYPYHTGYSVPFDSKNATNTSGVKIVKGKAFLDYTETEVDYLIQSSASQFIDLQPHEQSDDVGIMTLTPEVDTWSKRTELEQTTVELFEGFDNVIRDFANEAGFTGTQWNSWVTTSKISKKFKNKKAALKFLEANGATGVDIGKFSNKFGGIFGGLFGKKKKRITIQNQVASGVQTDLAFEDVEQNLGDYVKDIAISTYMRTRPVLVDATSLKPNTDFYAYFDGKNVTSFVKKLPSDFVVDNFNPDSYEGQSQTDLLAKFDTTEKLTSDADGNLVAMFIIPNDSTNKFLSGEKTLRLTNSPNNNSEEEDSYAEARFVSNGLEIDSSETVISTQVPRVKRQVVQRNRVCVRKNDPIAQSFTIEDDSGIFVTAVELAFAQKPPTGNAVLVYLVTMANGFPTENIVPGSETSLPHSSINVSGNSNTYTEFKFNNPIYLEPNTDYALIAFSSSYGYKVYISNLGGVDISQTSNPIISQQPAVGVFFTSANKKSWSVEQQKDLKFKIKRANFASNGSLTVKPIVGSGLHRIDISSFNDVNGAPFENVGWQTANTTAVVSLPESDDGTVATVEPVFNALNTSIVGFNILNPGSGYTSNPIITVTQTNPEIRSATFEGKLPEYKVGAFNLNQKFIELSGKTQISNILDLGTGVNSRSYRVESGEPVEDVINENFAINKDSASTDVKLRMSLTSNDSRLSPVIDLTALSLETREYAVKNIGDTSSYFTKPVYLETAADQLDVIIDVNRPTTSSNILVYGKFFDENNLPISSAYFTRSGSNSANRFSNVEIGWRVVENDTTPLTHTEILVATILDIQQVDGIWRYYYSQPSGASALSALTAYDLLPDTGTANLIDISIGDITLPSTVETDWLQLLPVSPKNIPVNSDRNAYSEVKFNVNPPGTKGFKQFSVKIEFRGENNIDVPTLRNFRAIASL